MAAWQTDLIFFAFSEARPPACYHRIRLSLPPTLTKNVGFEGVRPGTLPHPDPRLGHGEMHRRWLYLMGPPNEKEA